MRTVRCRVCVDIAAASVLLGAMAVANADSVPVAGRTDNRIRVAHYDPDQVFRLQAFVGYQIELELESGESVVGEGAGDLDGIAFANFGNHVFLKPKAVDVVTNLTITTNRRSYRFDYRVSAEPPDPAKSDVIYLVRFTYPTVPSAEGPSRAERVDQALESASSRRSRNSDYWFCGDPALRPTSASDDGVHTRITFGVRQELPALFARNEDGSESLLNFSMEDGDVIVHRVARRLIVRRGRLAGCIVNKAFSGGGERLDSGTVTPEVKRERTELRP